MKRFLLFALLMCSTGFAQVGLRYDNFTSTTVTSQQIGQTIYVPVPNATIAFCGYPATVVGGVCTNLAQTYTDSTLTTPCSTSTPIVLAGTNSCVATTDSQGNWGVWAPSGHYTYTVSANGSNYGPYDITLPINPKFYVSQFSGLLSAAVSACLLNPCTVIIDQPVSITGNYSVPSYVVLQNQLASGSIPITVSNGVTLTVNGGIFAADSQRLFGGAGAVSLGTQVLMPTFEWFGAVGDGATDDTTAIQNCLNAAVNTQCKGLAKTYLVSSAVTITRSITGIVGNCAPITNTTVYATPACTTILSNSSSAAIVDAHGINTANNIAYNIFKNFRVARSVTPTLATPGFSLKFSYGAMVSGVTSEDSSYDFYFKGVAAQGSGYIENCAATFGYRGVTLTSVTTLAGFYVDTADGTPSPSFRFRNSFTAANPSTLPHSASYTTYGAVLYGAAINDYHSFHFESATTDYGMWINATSATFGNSTDIFVNEPVNDGNYISSIYVNAIAGSVTIEGGWSFRQNNAAAGPVVDIESSSNVSLINHKILAAGGSGTGITANNSGSLQVIGNTIIGFGGMAATALSCNSTAASVFSGNTANNLNTTTGFNFVGCTTNVIANNTINGTATNGISLDAASTGNVGLETNQIGNALLGTITKPINNTAGNNSLTAPQGLKVNLGLLNGTGIQYLHTGATCTTAASAGATCSTTFTWGTAFADTTYDVVCQGDNSGGGSSGVATLGALGTKTTTTFAITTIAITAAAAQISALDCVGYHRN